MYVIIAYGMFKPYGPVTVQFKKGILRYDEFLMSDTDQTFKHIERALIRHKGKVIEINFESKPDLLI